MSEITPTNSLLTAISQFTEARKANSGETQKQSEDKQSLAADQVSRQARAYEGTRINVSSDEDVKRAQDNIRKAESQDRFRREAPNAGQEQKPQPKGQIIDIKV